MEEKQKKVIAIISEHFDVPESELTMDTDLVEKLHADSLDLVELIMAFEEDFDLTIPDEVALKIRTIKDIVDYLVANK